MDINPYTPGAGVKPSYLAGRDSLIDNSREILKYIVAGHLQRSSIFYGLRGVGKTVLLNEIENISEKLDFVFEHIEISENDNFKRVISLNIKKMILRMSSLEGAKDILMKVIGVFKAFSLNLEGVGEFSFDVDALTGTADSGDFQNDLTEMFMQLGHLALKTKSQVAFFVDEIQYLKNDDLEALIGATHRLQQKNLPVVIFGAGLPKIAKMAGDAKSYSERLYNFIEIGSLDKPNAIAALIEPAKKYSVTYTAEAIDYILKITSGYPYFIQEFGWEAWKHKSNNTIDLAGAQIAKVEYHKNLDKSFFKVRLDRASKNEKKFMYAMAKLGDGPYQINDIASNLEKELSKISLDRNNLINKGFIYSTSHGYLDFTVPQFNNYLMRVVE